MMKVKLTRKESDYGKIRFDITDIYKDISSPEESLARAVVFDFLEAIYTIVCHYEKKGKMKNVQLFVGDNDMYLSFEMLEMNQHFDKIIDNMMKYIEGMQQFMSLSVITK
ncbi:MAG: hypothetical protein E7517_03655 [Ruminococcaceae bacterium]|nr:hypothetical protein [Oscillospiraceae bacterium]